MTVWYDGQWRDNDGFGVFADIMPLLGLVFLGCHPAQVG